MNDEKQETAVVKAKPKTLAEFIENNKMKVQDVLPTHICLDRFIKSAILCIARSEKLQKCSPESVLTTIVNAGELGLDFTPAKGHAYMVPYWNSDKKCYEAQFMPGYRGFIELARRGGAVDDIEAHLVYENDIFEVEYGSNRRLVHKPCIRKERGSVIGAYAIAWMKGGWWHPEYMTLEDLNAIQKRSKASSGPWITDTGEMQRKTPIRRLFKHIPSSPDLDKALEFDNQASGIADAEAEVLDTKPISRTASLAAKLGVLTTPESEQTQEPESVPETKKEEPEAEARINYGDYVTLFPKEYNSLIAKYGNPLTDDTIDAYNVYLSDPKNEKQRNRDHNAALIRNLNRKIKDQEGENQVDETQAGLGL